MPLAVKQGDVTKMNAIPMQSLATHKWLSSVLSRADRMDDWLMLQRREALALLRKTPWPTQRTEAWKYTPVRVLDNIDLSTAAANSSAVFEKIDNLECVDLVFVDGRLSNDLSSRDIPCGMSVTSLRDASPNARQRIGEIYGKVKPQRHIFGLVNDVLANDGVLIDIDDGVDIDKPIRIAHLFNHGSESHTRILIRIGRGAKACVIEHASGSHLSVNTVFSEFSLDDRAKLEHYRFALQGGEAVSIGGSHFQLAGYAELRSTMVGFGSELSRLDVDVVHRGEHAQALLNAIYLLDQRELFDLHTTVEHIAANGMAEENVRGIAGGQARAVFNGRIHIHPGAQRTQAELNNRNLLVSDRAEIDTKPELEIYADDVRCAHGATVAQIDNNALYYLHSRGIDQAQARAMLNFAFINALIDQIPNEQVVDWLRPQLQQRFARMSVQSFSKKS